MTQDFNAYIPVIITASSAFIGAIIAQLVSHYLTIRRNLIAEIKLVYQNLYAPKLLEVIAYLETETHFRKGHDVEKEVNVKEIELHIEKNLKYADPNLISALEKFRKPEYFFDGRGIDHVINRYYLYFYFLDGLLNTNKHARLLTKPLKRQVQYYVLMYGLWYCISDLLNSHESGNRILSYKWNMSIDSYRVKKKQLQNVRHVMKLGHDKKAYKKVYNILADLYTNEKLNDSYIRDIVDELKGKI